MKKYFYYILAVVAVALISGFYIVQKSPGSNTNSFSLEAADQDLVSFPNMYRARVVEVLEENERHTSRFSRLTQVLEVEILDGEKRGLRVEAEYDETASGETLQKFRPGDTVVLGVIENPEESFVVIDRYRLPFLGIIAGLFVLLAIAFGRWRGVTSLVGLVFSIGILLLFIAPNILAGKSPVLVTMVGAGGIALVSIFLAHGFNTRAMLAVVSTLFTLGLAQVTALWFVSGAMLFGGGTQEALYLQSGYLGSINLQGLLLAGIIIGTLGVLDDVTTAQTATVDELKQADGKMTFRQLYSRGTSVGKEHIASLVNTLVLAYAGAALPLFLLFTINANQPVWAVLNSEFIAEEIVRTLVGSIALILAVPISTVLAAYYYSRDKG